MLKWFLYSRGPLGKAAKILSHLNLAMTPSDGYNGFKIRKGRNREVRGLARGHTAWP
jgi:hypothetical protein